MIATYVSSQHDCYLCQHADGAVVAYRHDGREKLVNDVKLNFESAAISDKTKALLAIAGRVQKGGKQVRLFDVSTVLASTAPPTKRSTTRCSSQLHSACTTDMWLAWQRGLRPTQRCVARRLAEVGYVESTA
jgi:hypothetical protein